MVNLKTIARKSPRFVAKRLFPFYSKQLNEQKANQFWTQPSPQGNDPRNYHRGIEKSEFLYQFMPKLDKKAKVLEIGCNVGRNLNYLYEKGYSNLSGIEINPHANRIGKKRYPKLYKSANMQVSSVQNVINNLVEQDLIYTMAVLQHIPRTSDFIFPKIANKAKKYIVTIEDEKNISERHFPRNYKRIFTSLGFKEIKSTAYFPSLYGFNGFVARVFKREIK